MMNSDLDMSKYPVDRKSWIEDIFLGSSVSQNCIWYMKPLEARTQGESPGWKVRRSKHLPCRMLVFDAQAEENKPAKETQKSQRGSNVSGVGCVDNEVVKGKKSCGVIQNNTSSFENMVIFIYIVFFSFCLA